MAVVSEIAYEVESNARKVIEIRFIGYTESKKMRQCFTTYRVARRYLRELYLTIIFITNFLLGRRVK